MKQTENSTLLMIYTSATACNKLKNYRLTQQIMKQLHLKMKHRVEKKLPKHIAKNITDQINQLMSQTVYELETHRELNENVFNLLNLYNVKQKTNSTHTTDTEQTNKITMIEMLYLWYKTIQSHNFAPWNLKIDVKMHFPKFNDDAPKITKQNPSQYRPIALQNRMYKMLDGCIKIQLEQHDTAHQIIYKNQGGLKKKERIIEHLYVAQTAFSYNKELYCAFLDLQKVYD